MSATAQATVVGTLAEEMARHNPQWSTPDGARDQCEVASFRYAAWIGHRYGIGYERITRARPAHVAVLADDIVVDLTMRQFHADAAFPWLGTYEQWHALLDQAMPA